MTRPFRSDLNQIPYDYTAEVTDRFKGLDLIECLENYGWRFITFTGGSDKKPSQRKINAKRQNGWLPDNVLQITEKRREANAKEKRKDIPI